MNPDESSLALERGRRHQSAGRYGAAIADYLTAADISVDALPWAWRRRSLIISQAIEPLIRAMRELEVSRIAIDEYLAAIGRPASTYRGFTSVDQTVFAPLGRTRTVAQAYLRYGGSARRREHLEMMLDIVEDEVADPRHGPTLLAYPHLRPLHARLHLITGRGLLARLNYQGALHHLDKAVRLAPCYGPAYRLLGEALVGLGRGVAAARCFDCAAAFWNPDWWPLEFTHGVRMRIPGIAVQGHDIFFWDDTFQAVRVSPRQRQLKMLALRSLRHLHSVYGRWEHVRPLHGFYQRCKAICARWSFYGRWNLRDHFKWIYRLRRVIASAVLRLPGALWLWLRIRPSVRRVMVWLRVSWRAGRRSIKAGVEHFRSGRRQLRGIVLSLLRHLVPRRRASEAKPRRTWREIVTLRLAQVEMMWGARPHLHAASLHEILELLDRVDA